MIDPLLQFLLALGYAALLLAAAVHKARAPAAFAATLVEYRLLPASWSRTAALLLTGVEALLGIAWLSGAGRSGVAFATAALMLVYATAIAVNLFRGRVHIVCGCGLGRPAASDDPLSWWLVARNVGLAVLALLCVLPASPREIGAYDWLTVILAMSGSALLLGAATQLARNRRQMSAWSRRD
jgi:hypothetical protein